MWSTYLREAKKNVSSKRTNISKFTRIHRNRNSSYSKDVNNNVPLIRIMKNLERKWCIQFRINKVQKHPLKHQWIVNKNVIVVDIVNVPWSYNQSKFIIYSWFEKAIFQAQSTSSISMSSLNMFLSTKSNYYLYLLLQMNVSFVLKIISSNC